MDITLPELTRTASKAKTFRLFLDYDGTLEDFAETPGIIAPDGVLISLMKKMVERQGMLPAIISGRRLSEIESLLPVDGLFMGGCYGIEMRLPNGSYRAAVPLAQVRPTVERLLPHWKALVEGRKGFILEDKVWSIALHARFALKDEAQRVLGIAVKAAEAVGIEKGFRLLGGERFLEYLPVQANKAIAVSWVLDEMTPDDALVVYFGDDEKDEEAFRLVLDRGGYAVHVGIERTKTCAQFSLTSPIHLRAWLADLLAARPG